MECDRTVAGRTFDGCGCNGGAAEKCAIRRFPQLRPGCEWYAVLRKLESGAGGTSADASRAEAKRQADHDAPVRLTVPTQLGYKSAKWIRRIELVNSLAALGSGKGGYWEDQGYEWYAGI